MSAASHQICNILDFLLEFGDQSMVSCKIIHIRWYFSGGKAMFPTIPKFTYGEQIELALSDRHMSSVPALNYT